MSFYKLNDYKDLELSIKHNKGFWSILQMKNCNFESSKFESMLRVYHNPRCRKSRAGLEQVKSTGLEPEVIEYLKTPFTPESLRKLLIKLNLKPIDIIRKQETLYKKELKGKNFTDEEWIKILCENPQLIRRPIVEAEYKAVLGDEPDALQEFLNRKSSALNQ